MIRYETSLGFSVKVEEGQKAADQHAKMKEKVLNAMKNVFRPEFINRLDATVVFHSLTREHIRSIVENEIKLIEGQLNSKGVTLEMTVEALDWIGERGWDPVFGARPLRRVIQNELEDRLSEALLRNVSQPVIRSRSTFKTARSCLLTCPAGLAWRPLRYKRRAAVRRSSP
jgi:ATP-dependent Clp protease ATP-binding subunit ClpC